MPLLSRSNIVLLSAVTFIFSAHESRAEAIAEAFALSPSHAPVSLAGPSGLPSLIASDAAALEKVRTWAHAAVQKASKRSHLAADQTKRWEDEVVRYMSFLGLGTSGEGEKLVADVGERLMNASLQFVHCGKFDDWACLESMPQLMPEREWRVDTDAALGEPMKAGASLEIQTAFTHRWNTVEDTSSLPPAKLASILGAKILADGKKSVRFAIYGIDDIAASLKPVYDAIKSVFESGSSVTGVQDIMCEGRKFKKLAQLTHRPKVTLVDLKTLFDFHYSDSDRDSSKYWAFDPQYAPGIFMYQNSVDLFGLLNAGIASDEQARVKLERVGGGIMHNKFLVLEDEQSNLGLWSGTTNLSRADMGDEENANMSFYFRNNTIIQESYLKEYGEMFSGRFHEMKSPNTHRYFVFADGTEARVHFSPTDDGEHRAILPMLLSAGAGDKVRISMFGTGGVEFVRAIQWAVAKGANVRIVLDKLTSSQSQSWVKDPFANLRGANPYSDHPKGTLEWRFENWAGEDHHKTGSLSRLRADGTEVAEMLIVGSQNWSKNGNDLNDENMLSVRNASGVPAAADFNRHFDEELWRVANLN